MLIGMQIAEAFADITYPGDSDIAGDANHCEECGECYEFFVGKHWRELASSAVNLPTNWAGPTFLTAKAKIFFLPAYLIQGLSDFDIADSAVYTLDNLRTLYEESTASLTREQCGAILAFIEFHLEQANGYDDASLWRLMNLYEYWKGRAQ